MPTEEQLKNRRLAEAGLPIGTITADGLTSPEQPIDFQTPEETPVFPVASLEIPKLEATPTETKAEGFTEQLQELTTSLVGEPEFRRAEEERVGIPAQEQAMEDLSQRLRDLQRQQKAIPLEMEEMAVGRGITRKGLLPHTTAELRRNAIEALTVSSLIDASQNRLVSAQRKVERSVEERFGTAKREIEVLRENLRLIQESPQATREEKQRALQQDAIQAEREREIERQEQITEHNLNLANQLAASGLGTPQDWDRIQKATSTVEATSIAQRLGLFAPEPEAPEALKTQVVEVAGRKKLINTQTGETIQDLGVADIPSEDDTTQEAVDAWARRINSGTDKISSVPSNIRNQVITRMKDFAEEDLLEDIKLGIEQNIKKEDLTSQLENVYPEFSKSEIETSIDTFTPTTPTATEETEGGGLISRIGTFFGSLFR